MDVRKMFAFLSLAFLLLLAAAPEAPAVSAIVSISPGGDGVFLLTGNAINNLDNMVLTVTYDPATMENLFFQEGEFVGGGTASATSSGPGNLRITVRLSEPKTGNGTFAKITYTPKGGPAGQIISLKGTLINNRAVEMPTIYQELYIAAPVETCFDLARDINRGREESRDVRPAQASLSRLGGVLGITFETPQGQDNVGAQPFIELLVETRSKLREAKQFALADSIRARLTEMGVALEDSPQWTTWRFQAPEKA